MAIGSVYTRKAQTKVHRHAFDTSYTIGAGKFSNLRLLAYSEVTQTPITGTTDQYNNLVVPEGSKVIKYWMDMTIIPSSNTAVQDVYIGWVKLSYHDYEDAKDTILALTKPSSNAIATDHSADLTFTHSDFRVNPKNRHWIEGLKKITMYGGRPASQSGWLQVPPKCRRSEEGMYWALFIANSSSSDITIKVSRAFSEFPLVN